MRWFFLSALILTLVSCTDGPSPASAQSPQDEYKKIQKDIRTQQKKLETIKKTEKSVLDDLNRATADLNETKLQIQKQKFRIRELKDAVTRMENEIGKQKEAIGAQHARLKKRLRVMQRMSKDKDALLLILSGDSTIEALKRAREMKDIAEYDQSIITHYRKALDSLSEKQNELAKRLHALRTEEEKLAKTERSLVAKMKERENLLVQVRKEKHTYEKMISELKESSQHLFRIIQDSEKREAELKKRRGSRQPSTPQEEAQEETGFSRLKGSLSWPVQGSVALHYGSQVDPIFNLPVFRSGIHIKAPSGAPVRAVHEGKVVFADSFKGYGRLVIVNHGGGYHTLYGNLSRIFSQNGAIIKDRQTIGEVGESGAIGTTGLYFEVRYKGKPLDPQQWLRR